MAHNILSVNTPAYRTHDAKIKLNAVILRLDRGIQFIYMDYPIKSGNDDKYRNNS